MRQVIIIGSGPAGLTAALYAARANLSPLLIEGLESGGQLMLTTAVENYPGFRDGIMGPDLMAEMRAQAARFGTEFVTGDVTGVELTQPPFTVTTSDTAWRGRSLIIATGASARLLGLPSERALMGHGVSTCATCDGYFFRDKPIAVVGGGDSAMEEATFLTKFASHVTVVHRRDTLRASKIMQEKAFRNPKISFEWDSAVHDITDTGKGVVDGIVLRNLKTGALKSLAVEGVFVAIGHTPNTGLFKGQVELDANGYIVPRGGARTSAAGVFAAGDVQDHVYRQAITAAGSGCMAAIDAERYLESLPESDAAAEDAAAPSAVTS
ncbi:MAG: thioredoxin-disulfide reductase [Acidobacteria bacterium]|nr:thioredoxin-disulfide reductase [Acidobacteriota bacterium]